MKFHLGLYLAFAVTLAAAASPVFVDPVAQFRVGFDTNPVASGAATPTLGADDTIVTAAGFGFGLRWPGADPARSPRIGYQGEVVRFDDRSSENFTTHRLSASVQSTIDAWKVSAEASALFIDGNRDTLPSLAASNGNATSLWRERREQWQYRAKVLAQRDTAQFRTRLTGTLLDYDYRTHVRAGRVAFADRGDVFGGADFGWKQTADSFWYLGSRLGAQHQDTVPLPGGEFYYASRYARVLAGWEGRLGANTSFTFAAGPDFRRYTGTIDQRVFPHRRHTFGWFETALTTKLSPEWTLTAKSTRWTWLSSTGKSALNDLAGEVQLTWTPSKALSFRTSLKAHQCSYFPAYRNDWERLASLGVTWKVSSGWQLSADLLAHHGWNELQSVPGREFDRAVFNVGVSRKL